MKCYCAGRFAIPPDIDFNILPHKSKSVVVVTFIGSLDSFIDKPTSLLTEEFLKQKPFSLPCVDTSIRGYYDVERKIIFLHYKDTEELLSRLLLNHRKCQKIFYAWESYKLKELFFLFSVSHFIVITSFGSSLDPRYVSLFKMINQMRHELYSSVEKILKVIAVSSFCASIARVACPQLLFVLKLPPTIAARNLAKNPNALANFERNLSLQIYNVFFESGLLDELFTLDGFHTVRVLLPDCIAPILACTERYANDDDFAQQMLEDILSSTGIPSLTADFDTRKKRQPPEKGAEYSAPSAPRNQSFASFLESNVSNLMEDIEHTDLKDPNSKNLPELPSVKCWFIICFKLYTSLFGTGNSSEQNHSTMPCLFNEWEKRLPNNPGPCPITNSKLFASQSHFDRELSIIRCEKAYAAAEAHYLKDLPAHYSLKYHQARVISSYNAFFNLARGPRVVPCLKDLTRRLARLYLAGRVNCPVRLISGSTCRWELHAIPQSFPGISRAILYLQAKSKPSHSSALQDGEKSTDCYRLMKHIKAALTSAKASSISHDNILQNCLQDVPCDLKGPWQYAWIEGVAKVLEQGKDKVDPALSGIVKDAASFKHLSIMPHRSFKRFLSACNCGQTAAVRNDPYDYKEANWNFYSNLEARCCYKRKNIPLAPMFLMEKGHDMHTRFEFSNIYSMKQEAEGIQKMPYSAGPSQSTGYFNKDLLDVVDEPAFVPTALELNFPFGEKMTEGLLKSAENSSKVTGDLKDKKSQNTSIEELPKSSKEISIPDEHEADQILRAESEKMVLASPKKNEPMLEPSESILASLEKPETTAEQVEGKFSKVASRDEKENSKLKEHSVLPGKSIQHAYNEQKKKSLESIAVPEINSVENKGALEKEEHSKESLPKLMGSRSIDPSLDEKVDQTKVRSLEEIDVGMGVEECVLNIAKSEVSKKMTKECADSNERSEVSVPNQKELGEKESVKEVEIRKEGLDLLENALIGEEEKEAFNKEPVTEERLEVKPQEVLVSSEKSSKKKCEATSKDSQVSVRKPELTDNPPKNVEEGIESLDRPSDERTRKFKQTEESSPPVDDLAIRLDSLTFVDVFSKANAIQSGEKSSSECSPLVDPSSLENKVMVEFCDDMPVLGQPLHIMPLYSSWSICRLGKYSKYSHYYGLSAPGFLRDGNYLLPNDVPLHCYYESPPTPSKSKVRSNRPRDLDSVKLFIGYEMECPLGHRFFLAGIDRPMTGNMTSGEVKRAVRELLESDIPIFTPCRCSRAQQEASEESITWAQLMRVYVAIPNVLIGVRFAPVVQVGEGCPSFHLGPTLDKLEDLHENSDALESSLSQPGYVNLDEGFIWVLRLPFAYQHGGVVYHRPQDPSQVKRFCLLKSNIQILHV